MNSIQQQQAKKYHKKNGGRSKNEREREKEKRNVIPFFMFEQ